ncbi:coiled-coil domain-containing protein 170 [Erpetoichthys calabaricus]|uniref:coiled-coil domain-containing protein 170 n=1 Tax=Erpetoichthys calabaricus TaxID=27687 RepID=UPI0010A001D0|nr:coiled-coil domain-containing protein 170 [Erpetoichthys calabaricus]
MSTQRPDSAFKLIDVNKNDSLRAGHSVSSNRLLVLELQEQLSVLRRQLEDKDELLAALTVGRNASRGEYQRGSHDSFQDAPVTREQLNYYRLAAETANSELAALQVKHECSQAELLEVRAKLSSRETLIHEMRQEMENYKENNARQASVISSLRSQVQELEQESGTVSSSKTRTELALQSTSKENSTLKERLQELENKLRLYMNEWDDTQQKASSWERKHKEFLSHLSARLNLDSGGKEEHIISKLDELCQENARQKSKLTILEESMETHEVDSKASRETIMRLVAEVAREQKASASSMKEVESLRQELESIVLGKRNLERENRALLERAEANRRAWEVSKQELGTLEKRSKELDGSLRSSQYEMRSTQNLLHGFREELADLLSGQSGMLQPSEEAIKERIVEMSRKVESQKEALSQEEAKVSRVTEQLERQTELLEAALLRAKQAERHLSEFRGKLNKLEGELITGDVLRDSMSVDKQSYLRFLDQLSEKMKLDRLTADVGFDMRLDAILSRTDQLVKLENNAVTDTKTLAHNLQRKVKTQKEQLESKELHMEMLRKKIAQLEEEKKARSALAVERDEAILNVRKLQKKVERLQKELGSSRVSNTDLKAKLSDTNELKIKTLEQNEMIEELSKSLKKLEKMKHGAEKRLTSLKSEMDFTSHKSQEERERTRNLLEAVTSELTTLKKSLEDVVKRERQLVDFREVVSQMLGLNVSTLALPDYEIIKRLEKLIHSHHSHAGICLCLENSRESFCQDFHGGCAPARRAISAQPAALTISPAPVRFKHS